MKFLLFLISGIFLTLFVISLFLVFGYSYYFLILSVFSLVLFMYTSIIFRIISNQEITNKYLKYIFEYMRYMNEAEDEKEE